MEKPFKYSLYGLDARDMRVYETLIREQEAISIRSLADSIKLNYGTTYEVIKKLQKIGLISAQYRLKRKYYVAENPDVLQAYAVEQQVAMAHELENIKNYTMALKAETKNGAARQFTKFYDGEEEVAALLMDVLTTVSQLETKQYQVFSSAEVRNHLYAKFRNFTRRRVQLGIEVQVIGVGKVGRKAKYAQRRQLAVAPRDVPAAYVIIYGEKVAQITLPQTGYIQAVVVQDAAISMLQRMAFQHLWNRSWQIDDPRL